MQVIEPSEVVNILEKADELSRVPGERRRKGISKRMRIKQDLRAGRTNQVDKTWLLEQLLIVYQARDCKFQDKLRALELMARLSGYGSSREEPQDERQAIADLMADMKADVTT